jgi:hypothetical protein
LQIALVIPSSILKIDFVFMSVIFIISSITITRIRIFLIMHNVVYNNRTISNNIIAKASSKIVGTSININITIIILSSVKSGDGLVLCPKMELHFFSS